MDLSRGAMGTSRQFQECHFRITQDTHQQVVEVMGNSSCTPLGFRASAPEGFELRVPVVPLPPSVSLLPRNGGCDNPHQFFVFIIWINIVFKKDTQCPTYLEPHLTACRRYVLRWGHCTRVVLHIPALLQMTLEAHIFSPDSSPPCRCDLRYLSKRESWI